MAKTRCKATTLQGGRCGLEARASGYCHLHDPELLEAKRREAEAAEARSKPLNQVLEVLTATCEARGWSWEVDSIDNKDFRHASFNVKRHVDTGPSSQQVTGLCEVIVDGGVKISLQKTSFYPYGITQLHEALVDSLGKISWLEKSPKKGSGGSSDTRTTVPLEPVLRRFHVIARQLRRRHDDRTTLTVDDEYDVQDLLHAILRGLFDDVRPEEGTPSYAGGSSRMDFLLKTEKTVVETKMGSGKLRDKSIGEQLIVDIRRYQAHPDCRRLVCFVYDPGGDVKNPEGLEKDLSGKHGDLEVRVIVAPR